MIDELYMKLAFEQGKIAYKKNDVPVGAVIVMGNKIISQAYNKKNISKNAIKHAEIIAIEKACKKLKTWHLDECTLYVTLEPCLMCCGAIIQSRIKRVVYGAKCEKFGFAGSIDNVLCNKKNNHLVEVKSGVLDDLCSEILKEFFLFKRNKK